MMLLIPWPVLFSQPVRRHDFGKVRFPKFGLEFELAPPPPLEFELAPPPPLEFELAPPPPLEFELAPPPPLELRANLKSKYLSNK